MKVSISTNGYKILSHGDVFLYDGNSEMTMNLEADTGFKFSITFRFIQDSNQKQALAKELENNTIVFKCINFKNEGTGTTKPISIATVSDKEWLLHFWSYVESTGGPRRVEYTILEKE